MKEKRNINLMIVEDNPYTIFAIKDLIEDDDTIEPVAEALNGRQAVKLSKELNPDVILMDVMMPVMDGIEATRIISREIPHTKVIAFTSFGTESKRKEMAEAGAVSFLEKSDITADRLIEEIKSVFGKEKPEMDFL